MFKMCCVIPNAYILNITVYKMHIIHSYSGVPRGGFGVFKPPPEIPKALQNRAKLKPIVKTV